MLVGYARVSTQDQSLTNQIATLREEGCGVIFSEAVTGSGKKIRPEWEKCLESLQEGDELRVVALDRCGRSLLHLVELIDTLDEKGVALVCTAQGINTGGQSSTGRLLVSLLSLIADFERSLISERTKAALVGRPRGRNGGRPVALSQRQLARCQQLYDEGSMSLVEIARSAGVSKSTLCRHLTLTKRPVAG